MVEPEDSGVDWAQRPAGGWAEFVAARRRFMAGRAWDSLVWRLERMDGGPGAPAADDRGDGGDALPPAAGGL
jgi:hypothetical protein